MGFVLRFSSTVLANTLAYQREMLLRKHNAALLEMARNLFSSVSEFLLMHAHYALNVYMYTPLNYISTYSGTSLFQVSEMQPLHKSSQLYWHRLIVSCS